MRANAEDTRPVIEQNNIASKKKMYTCRFRCLYWHCVLLRNEDDNSHEQRRREREREREREKIEKEKGEGEGGREGERERESGKSKRKNEIKRERENWRPTQASMPLPVLSTYLSEMCLWH